MTSNMEWMRESWLDTLALTEDWMRSEDFKKERVMSAFIVDDQTINRVVTWLSQESNSREDYGSLKRLAKEYSIDFLSEGWDETLGRRMFLLNCTSVNERYGDGQAEEFRPLDFVYRYQPHPSLVQILKSLQCWLYQCDEGDISETKLYQFFTEVANRLALKIVMDSPAYEKAQWG